MLEARLVLAHVNADYYAVATPDLELWVEQLSLANRALVNFRVGGVGGVGAAGVGRRALVVVAMLAVHFQIGAQAVLDVRR